MALIEKQKRFAEYFIERGNATEAAKKVGYCEKTAGVIGNENLNKPYVKEYINKMLEKHGVM